MAGSGEVDPRRAGRVYAAAVTATARRNSALNNPSSNRESGAREAGPADKPNGTQAVWRAEFSTYLGKVGLVSRSVTYVLGWIMGSSPR